MNSHIMAQGLQPGFFDGTISEICSDAFSITSAGLSQVTGIAKDRVAAFIKCFSATPGKANDQYNAVDDYNEAKSHPIIVGDGDAIYLFQSHSLCESLYVSPFFWMQRDDDYKTTARRHRGEFLEQKILQRLQRVFGPENVFANVEILDGKSVVGEIDILVRYIDRLIIVQAKSKTLTLKAQQGSSAHIQDDFKKAVQVAYDQAYECSTKILSRKYRLKKECGEELKIHKRIAEVFPICVVADHYPSLYFQSRQFLRTKTTRNVNPPYVMDVFLLDVMTEFLTHPIRMLDFLKKRTEYNTSVSGNNDFAILGYHLSNNLYKDPEYNMMMLHDDLAWEVDKAFISRRQYGDLDALPEGVLTAYTGTPYGEIIELLKGFREDGAIDLGYLLLSYDGVSIDAINQGINQLSRAARKSGRTHDFTVCGPEGGITYHIAQKPSAERLDFLLNHAKLRKYSTKSCKWFALSGTVGQGEPVDTICFLNERWRRNPEMDAKVARMPIKPSKLSHVKGRITVKLGRNDKCHCGSGLKYKKCCLWNDEKAHG